MRIINTISFDISTKSTGYCIWKDKNLVLSGSIVPGKISIYNRLIFIKHSVRGILFSHQPDFVILEDYLFSYKTSRKGSNRALVQMAEIGGIIKNIVIEEYKQADLITFPIHTIKSFATGKGNAGKLAMQNALPKERCLYSPIKKTGNINIFTTEDEVDAYWVAQTFFNSDHYNNNNGKTND